MGTDIHLFVEKKSNGFWEGVVGPNPQISMHLSWAKREREKGNIEEAERNEKKAADIASGAYLQHVTNPWELSYYGPKVFEGWLYNGRNYDLFAILGNVRNGHGFAGVQTGEGFNYISDNRGLPEDVSSEVEEELGNESYYHSVSYVTLNELINFDWEQTTVQYGVVDEKHYKEWKENGFPTWYSGGVSGQRIVHVDNDTMDAIVNGDIPKEEGKEYYTRVEWKESYKDAVGSFYTESIPALEKLSEQIDASDVRIVFGFDS